MPLIASLRSIPLRLASRVFNDPGAVWGHRGLILVLSLLGVFVGFTGYIPSLIIWAIGVTLTIFNLREGEDNAPVVPLPDVLQVYALVSILGLGTFAIFHLSPLS